MGNGASIDSSGGLFGPATSTNKSEVKYREGERLLWNKQKLEALPKQSLEGCIL
jgi:hypothetical protein